MDTVKISRVTVRALPGFGSLITLITDRNSNLRKGSDKAKESDKGEL